MMQPAWTNSSALKFCYGCGPWQFQPLRAMMGQKSNCSSTEGAPFLQGDKDHPTDTTVGNGETLCS